MSMHEDILHQRQRWFRFFPEGCLEFLIATRALALVVLLSLLLLRQAQRPLLLTGLVGILWVDYALMVWWAVQTAMDLVLCAARQDRTLPGAPSGTDATMFERRRDRRYVALQVMLPSIVAAILLAPWLPFLDIIFPGLQASTAGAVLWWVNPAMVVVFVVLVVAAQRPLRKIGIASGPWTVALMIPVLHWVALHRLAVVLENRIEACRGRPAGDSDGTAPRSTPLSVALADALWVIMVLPWLVFLVLVVVQDRWPESPPWTMLPFCGTILVALFSVADLAALERVQRRHVELLAKMPQPVPAEPDPCD